MILYEIKEPLKRFGQPVVRLGINWVIDPVEYQTKFGRLIKHSIGILLTIVCLVVFFRQVELDKLFHALVNFNYVYLIFGVIFLGIGYAFRILRWSIMLKSTGADTGFKACIAPFLGSITLNNILPFRIGDVVRALVFPASMGISKTTATSSLIAERLVDLLTLLICFAMGLFAVEGIQIPKDLKYSVIVVAFIGVLVITVGFFFSKPLSNFLTRLSIDSNTGQILGKVCNIFGNLLYNINKMYRPKVFSNHPVSFYLCLDRRGYPLLFYYACFTYK